MPMRQQFIVYQSDGLFYWKFVANTRRIIAVSPHGYEDEFECLEAIDMMQDQVRSAPVVDQLFEPAPLMLVK